MRKSTVAILIVAAAFAAFIFYSLFRVEPVRVVASHLEHRGGQVFVDGSLRNTGPDLGPLDLEAHYYDANGARARAGQDRRRGDEDRGRGPFRDPAAAARRRF